MATKPNGNEHGVYVPMLRKLRRKRGWTQERLAAEAIVDVSTVKRAEKKLPDAILPSKARKLLEALGHRHWEQHISDEPPGSPAANEPKDEERSWFVRTTGPLRSAPNGLQWTECEMGHVLMDELRFRGKHYNLEQHAEKKRWKELVEHVTRHARVCMRLNHPHIARNYAVHEDSAHPHHFWVIDEWMEGDTLAKAARGKGLPPAQAALMMFELASALEALHAADIPYRSLSPESIRLSPKSAILTDFELAKLSDGRPSVSPREWPYDIYRAPEVGNSKGVSVDCDMYSWAMILAFALCGREPASPTDALGILQTQGEKLPKRLKETAAKCLKGVPRPSAKSIVALRQA